MRIVVVEDEANAREGIVRLIERINAAYQVVAEAENGQEGFECIDRIRPDLVITDIKMPVMSGIEMLDKLKKIGHTHKTIVLTGYSEFEYARKALQLGVVDYLEKPITANDLRAALLTIEQELVDQQLLGLPNLPPAEQAEHLIVRTITRDDVNTSLVSRYLERIVAVDANRPFQWVQWYAGARFNDVWEEIKGIWQDKSFRDNSSFLFAVPTDRSINLLMPQDLYEGAVTLPSMDAILKNAERQVVISMTRLENLSEMRDGFRQLCQYRKWSIIDTNLAILSEKAIGSLNVKQFHYPEQLENRMRAAVTDSNGKQLQQAITDWINFCYGAIYPPDQLIDATTRFVLTLLNLLAREYGNEITYERQKSWLEAIVHAQTKSEFIAALQSIEKQTVALFKKDQVYSLSVNKALRLIHSHYTQGITLEEIASMLRITPEYLSTLFNKEVGKTYSAYMKEIRINRAKQLLIHSEMKIFEIAENIGYPDAKYFSRVFKESTGISPGEYQRLHKDQG